MEIARDPYSMALLGLIYAKKRCRKSHAWAPLSIYLSCGLHLCTVYALVWAVGKSAASTLCPLLH
jgi:hypothetical protein